MQNDQTKTSTAEENKERGGNDVSELLRAMAVAAIIAVMIRSFLFEPFNIPSSSMYPTLLVGDYLFVEKYAYGYSKYSFPFGVASFSGRFFESPVKRGDIAVFRLPSDTNIDYIKRIIGLPGDTVQVREGLLYINDKIVPREFKGAEDFPDENAIFVFSRYSETLPNGKEHDMYELSDAEMLDDTDVYMVPAGHYFAMGDNRDKSQDSRVTGVVGPVPAENLVGRAAFIFFSLESVADDCKVSGALSGVRYVACAAMKWPSAIRYSRIFKGVNG